MRILISWFWKFIAFSGLMLLYTALIAFISGFSVIGYQGIEWLKSGRWTPMPLRTVVYFDQDWDWRGVLGAQKIWDAILTIPLSAAIIFASFLVSVAAIYIHINARLKSQEY